MRICFDMDGTIANLYAVENWLSKLRAYDASPYRDAEVMVNMNTLARYLNRLQKSGYEIGVISWLSKCPNADYDAKVTNAKKAWLKKHLRSVNWDFVEIVPYGTDKNLVLTNANDILFDDEEQNRTAWNGTAYNVENILKILKKMLDK